MKKVSKEDVTRLASLAQFQLDDAATEVLAEELNDIFAYMDKLNALNTDDVPATFNGLDLHNVLREDKAETTLSRDDALMNAPLDDGEYFLVPKILEGEDGA